MIIAALRHNSSVLSLNSFTNHSFLIKRGNLKFTLHHGDNNFDIFENKIKNHQGDSLEN